MSGLAVRNAQPLPLTTVARDRVFIHQGRPCHGFWQIESGAMVAEVVSHDGRLMTVDVLGPDDGLGEPLGRVSTVTVRSLTPCRLRGVSSPAAIAELLSKRADRVARLACEMAWLGVGTRVEARLEDLARRFGAPVRGGVAIRLRLSQELVASLAGTSRESANRAMRRLEDQGSLEVRARGRYVLKNQLRLV